MVQRKKGDQMNCRAQDDTDVTKRSLNRARLADTSLLNDLFGRVFQEGIMKLKQLLSALFTCFAVGTFSVLLTAGQLCPAQTARVPEIAKANTDSSGPAIPDSNADPSVPQPAPTPVPQTGNLITSLSRSVTVQKRVFPE